MHPSPDSGCRPLLRKSFPHPLRQVCESVHLQLYVAFFLPPLFESVLSKRDEFDLGRQSHLQAVPQLSAISFALARARLARSRGGRDSPRSRPHSKRSKKMRPSENASAGPSF